MALAKSKPAEKKPSDEEKVDEQAVADAKAQEQADAKTSAPKGKGRMVEVRNLRNTFFHQPDTGLRIEAHGTKDLLDDSWLELQVKANLLERVK